MAFPVTARYLFHFRHSDTGLTPSFSYFRRTDTFAVVAGPSIVEFMNGVYYFDYTFTTAASPEIVFEVDGGVGLPVEVRYVTDTISPKDWFVDDLKGASNIDNTQINTTLSTVAAQMIRAMGLLHENSVMDQTLYNGGNNLTSARLRIYNSKANANAATGTGLLATYTVAATYTGDNLLTYTVVLEP